MKALTHEEINNIIDQAECHAKAVCDHIYNKATKEIGSNDYFKTILDNTFDELCKIEIRYMKECFDTYFELGSIEMSVKDIHEYLHALGYMHNTRLVPARGSGNTLKAAIIDTVNNSIKQAFVEKLAEYLEIDISEVIK